MEKFDMSLITGTGRGRPKAEGFVRHVCAVSVGYRSFCPSSLLDNRLLSRVLS